MEETGNDSSEKSENKETKPFLYCRLVCSYPKTSFAITLCGHLLILGVTLLLMALGYDLFPTNFDTLPMHDWNVPWRRRDWAWKFRDDYKHKYNRKLYQQSLPRWFRSKEYARGNIVLYYDAGNKNIFTKQNLQKIEYIENTIISLEQYQHYCVQNSPLQCAKPASILRLFDGTYANVSPVFYDPNYNNIPAVLYTASTNARTKKDFFLFLDKHGSIGPGFAHASVTRTIIPLGYPLNTDKDIARMEKTMQSFLVDSFKPLILKLKADTEGFDLVYWSYLLFKSDLAKQALRDAVLAAGSVLFIFCFIVYHTKSLWISSFAVMSIGTSFLAANMIYRIMLDFRYIGFFHIIAIFIILGIGADDLFIFLDVWKNTAYNSYPSLAHRLSDSYRRSVVSMFVTSLTTVIAFFASAFSPLLPAKSFGVFAGLLIIVNYISVVIFFPCVVILHHVYFKNCQWPCFKCIKSKCCFRKKKPDADKRRPVFRSNQKVQKKETLSHDSNIWTMDGTVNDAFDLEKDADFVFLQFARERLEISKDQSRKNERNTTTSEDTVFESDTASDENNKDSMKAETKEKKFLVRFFRGSFFKFVTHRICRLVLLLTLVTVVVFFTYSTTKLEPDNEQTKFYRSGHNYARAIDFDSYGFKKNFADRDVVVNIAWGLRPRDMSGCHFSDENCQGIQRYDDMFNPNTVEAQVALMRFCNALHSLSPKEILEFRIRRDAKSGLPEIRCFMTDLQRFLWRESMATGADLSLPWDLNKAMAFLRSRPLLYDTSRINQTFSNILQIPISYWLNDGYRYWNKTAFYNYSPLIGEVLSPYSTPLRIDYSVFFGNKIQYLAVQVNLTLGRFSTGYKTGKPVMDRWENFVNSQIRQMPPGLQNGFQLTKTYWHSLSVQKTMADNAIFGIVLGVVCAFPILTVATKNVIIAFVATLSLCCSIVCVVGILPLAGWKLGLVESLNMCMVVGLSVDYVVHLAEGYYMSAHADRMSRVRDMLEEVGISVFSGACTTLGASLLMLFAQILFIIKFGIIMFCTIGFSLIFSLGFFTTIMGIFGPTGKSGDIKEFCGKIVRLWRARKTSSYTLGGERCMIDETRF